MGERPTQLPLIEPVPIEDELCTGLALIEDLGFGGRLVFCSQQTCYESGATIWVVKRKIVLPGEALPPLAKRTLAFLGRGAIRAGVLQVVC